MLAAACRAGIVWQRLLAEVAFRGPHSCAVRFGKDAPLRCSKPCAGCGMCAGVFHEPARQDEAGAPFYAQCGDSASSPNALGFSIIRPRTPTASPEIERLIELLAKLPGLGPRSARRAALHLLKKRETLLSPLADALAEAAGKVAICSQCGSLDAANPCVICADPRRDRAMLCVVAEVGDVWALERAGAFRGRYHVLGGVLSALDGVRPEDLRIGSLLERAAEEGVREVILALAATVDGQTTAHVLGERLAGLDVTVTRLAHGVPVGGELEHLDDGTLLAALAARRTAR